MKHGKSESGFVDVVVMVAAVLVKFTTPRAPFVIASTSSISDASRSFRLPRISP